MLHSRRTPWLPWNRNRYRRPSSDCDESLLGPQSESIDISDIASLNIASQQSHSSDREKRQVASWSSTSANSVIASHATTAAGSSSSSSLSHSSSSMGNKTNDPPPSLGNSSTRHQNPGRIRPIPKEAPSEDSRMLSEAEIELNEIMTSIQRGSSKFMASLRHGRSHKAETFVTTGTSCDGNEKFLENSRRQRYTKSWSQRTILHDKLSGGGRDTISKISERLKSLGSKYPRERIESLASIDRVDDDEVVIFVEEGDKSRNSRRSHTEHSKVKTTVDIGTQNSSDSESRKNWWSNVFEYDTDVFKRVPPRLANIGEALNKAISPDKPKKPPEYPPAVITTTTRTDSRKPVRDGRRSLESFDSDGANAPEEFWNIVCGTESLLDAPYDDDFDDSSTDTSDL